MSDTPTFLLTSVNMWKRNAVTHALLNYTSHAHLILLQEPWYDKTGTARHDDSQKGVNMLGGVAAPSWELLSPALGMGLAHMPHGLG
jgi:hypothetical protein